MSKQETAGRALRDSDLWATCEHAQAEMTSHSCPTCGGTLRRCCFSLVGYYSHQAACPEIARRSGGVQ